MIDMLSIRPVLYLIEILHQTTTAATVIVIGWRLYLIEILHQTTTCDGNEQDNHCCILSKFYIKPQLRQRLFAAFKVVSYRNSTSNHNYEFTTNNYPYVVSYRNSTSNHNYEFTTNNYPYVVSYRNSTSNHNVGPHID